MRRMNVWMLFMTLLIVAGSVWADAESDGRAAEQAGRHREALELYTKALESTAAGSAQERQLRERIIDVAKNVKPAPAVPQEAQRRLARAQGFIELAKTPEDYQRPADELRAGLRIAPWWAEGYYNLAAVLEKAEKYAEAMSMLKLYARAAEGKEAQAAELAIARLEAKAEASSPAAKAAQETSKFADFARSLEGVMFAGPWESFGGQFRAHVRNGQIIFGSFHPEMPKYNSNLKADFGLFVHVRAPLSGYRVSFNHPHCAQGMIEITADGRSMTVRTDCSALNKSLRRQ